MKRCRRFLLPMIVVGLVSAYVAPAHGLSIREGSWEAGTCKVKSCTYGGPTGDFFTQAAGHPQWGITTFEVNAPGGKPDGVVKRIRVDVPEGLAANPQALPSCSRAEFDSSPALC